MKLKDAIRAVQQELPITMRMDRWIAENPNPVYSERALAFARAVLGGEVGGKRVGRQPFRSSGIGTCQRKQLFASIGLPEVEVEAKLGNIFHTGNFLHLKWQMAGLTEGWLAHAEVPRDLMAMRFGGTLDGILFDGSGFEFKTINSNGFSQVMAYGPKAMHRRQIHGYMLLEPSITEFSVIYEDKNTGEWREFREHRDDAIARAVASELDALNMGYEKRKLPAMLPDCETGEGPVFRSCPFRAVCPTIKRWPSVVAGVVV